MTTDPATLLAPPRWTLAFANLEAAWAGVGRAVTSRERLELLDRVDEGAESDLRRDLAHAAGALVESFLAAPKPSEPGIDRYAAVRADIDEVLLLADLWAGGTLHDAEHVRRAALVAEGCARSPGTVLANAGREMRGVLLAAVGAAAAVADVVVRPRATLVAWGRDLVTSLAYAVNGAPGDEARVEAGLVTALTSYVAPDLSRFRPLDDARAEAVS